MTQLASNPLTSPPRAARLSAIVPATNLPPTLERCLGAIERADDPPEEIVLSRRVTDGNAPEARNGAAERASGEILVFIDSDVEVHPDVFSRIRAAFAEDPDLTAVFGSYDDAPAAPGVVSRFRNLLHYHVHQRSPGPAETFWTGLGAIRRDTFLAWQGFDRERYHAPSVEDIELGMRLVEAGASIRLDPRIQGKHLKPWSFLEMLRTDLMHRGVPWVTILLRRGRSSDALNLGWTHRLSAVAAGALVVGAALLEPLIVAAGLVSLLALNVPFYRLLARRQGVLRAAVGVLLHAAHLLTAVVSVPVGVGVYLWERRRSRRRAAGLNRPEAAKDRGYQGPDRRRVAEEPQISVVEGPFHGGGRDGSARQQLLSDGDPAA